jgi:hypothetical protein
MDPRIPVRNIFYKATVKTVVSIIKINISFYEQFSLKVVSYDKCRHIRANRKNRSY